MIAFSTEVSLAADKWSSSEAWGSQQTSYAPDFGNTSMRRYDSSDGNEYVTPKARFRFTVPATNSIRDYYVNDDTYYTFDVSIIDANNRSMTAYFYIYTTLPDPKKDWDDDPEWRGGNGFYDETEAVSLSNIYSVGYGLPF